MYDTESTMMNEHNDVYGEFERNIEHYIIKENIRKSMNNTNELESVNENINTQKNNEIKEESSENKVFYMNMMKMGFYNPDHIHEHTQYDLRKGLGLDTYYEEK